MTAGAILFVRCSLDTYHRKELALRGGASKEKFVDALAEGLFPRLGNRKRASINRDWQKYRSVSHLAAALIHVSDLITAPPKSRCAEQPTTSLERESKKTALFEDPGRFFAIAKAYQDFGLGHEISHSKEGTFLKKPDLRWIGDNLVLPEIDFEPIKLPETWLPFLLDKARKRQKKSSS